jgi:hypothetical protein
MDETRIENMDHRSRCEEWILREARLSFRYWHSSRSARKDMAAPFFDRNQCQQILKEFPDETPKDLVA